MTTSDAVTPRTISVDRKLWLELLALASRVDKKRVDEIYNQLEGEIPQDELIVVYHEKTPIHIRHNPDRFLNLKIAMVVAMELIWVLVLVFGLNMGYNMLTQ